MHPAFLYVPGVRLSLPELTAARLDGHVFDLGDAYVPADLVEGADVRAATIAHHVQDGAAACGPSAAWIHGARDAPPPRHHVRRCVTRRIRPASNPRVVFHDSALPEGCTIALSGIPVTSVERTLVDLALGLHRDPALGVWLDDLATLVPEALDGAISTVRSGRRVPGSRAALAALDGVLVRIS